MGPDEYWDKLIGKSTRISGFNSGEVVGKH